jgi:hypothetical protein
MEELNVVPHIAGFATLDVVLYSGYGVNAAVAWSSTYLYVVARSRKVELNPTLSYIFMAYSFIT